METFTLFYKYQTPAAILVYESDPDETFWVPKSQIEYDYDELSCASPGDEIEINMPEWLAIDKDLL